jgi:hypothetical protein
LLGKTPLLNTTLAVLPEFRKSNAWGQLPKTFQDAVTVTRKLGIRYLWIDSLCIIQDSKADWAEEAPKMSEIYGNSYVTIAAFVDVDTHSGFLRERPDKVLSKSHIRSIKSRKEIDHVSSLG